MEVKYVHLKDGTLLIFSKYCGLQHAEMAARVCEALPADVADAGFVDFYEGKFEVFGKSLSLGVESADSTNKLLNECAATLNVYDLNSNNQWFATNRDTEHELVGTGLDGMRKFKII